MHLIFSILIYFIYDVYWNPDNKSNVFDNLINLNDYKIYILYNLKPWYLF